MIPEVRSPAPSTADRRRPRLAWAAWALVVVGLFNAGPTYRERREMHEAQRAGAFGRTLGERVLEWRDELADDGDVRRYFSYASAALGRPHPGFYVRPLSEWLASFERDQVPVDPDLFPERVVPPRPLVPYRDFAVEYPPGFFLIALPPALLTRDADVYRVLFDVWMALLLTLAILACERLASAFAPDGERVDLARLVAWSAACAFALGKVATHRYDAAVALLLPLMALAAMKARPVFLGVAMGIAIAAKSVPVAVAPVFLVYLVHEGRRRELVAAVLATTATLGAFALPTLWLAGPALLDVLHYHAARPLQIESTAAVLLGLWHAIDPSSLRVVQTFGSTNVTGRYTEAALSLLPWLALIVISAVAWITLRRLRRQPDAARRGAILVEGTAATLALLMVVGKVFSPQYLVWLLPLGVLCALRRGGRLPWLFVAVLSLTHVVFPTCYGALSRLAPWACALVLSRSALLAYFAIRLLGDSPSRPRALDAAA